jgi:4-diphosphocytidyl-2-C-methyl-D-erythritol kinase
MADPRIRSKSKSRVAGQAPAKLNLFLEVLGRRPDGYHELRTVFHEIDLADEIAVELRPDRGSDSIALSGLPVEGPVEKNLALLAASAFRRRVAACPPIHVELEKKVPLGSGMGGGSSDAAFVVRALRDLVRPDASPEALHAAARDVGADVAFFLAGGTALGAARGDELTAIEDAARYWFLLAMPRFSLSTARVYEHVDLIAPRADVSSFVEGMRRTSSGKPVTGCFNRLEAAASRVEPRLASLLEELRARTRAPWCMTGSGSTLFAPMSTSEEGESVARRVTGTGAPDFRIVKSFGAPPTHGRA